jgi:hypothetical protein
LTPVADTSLWQRESWKNAGGSDLLPAGSTSADGDTTRCRLLVRFTLTNDLPANAQIESASLHLQIVRAPSLPDEKPINGSTFTLRRTLQSWGEGTKAYTNPLTPMQTLGPATAGESTWLYRFFGDESKRWIVPGGDLTDGDFAEAPSGDFFVGSGPGGAYSVNLSAQGLQDIRDWLADPAENHGWMLKTESEQTTGTARLFAAREHATEEFRPRLVINYSLPEPVAPEIVSIAHTGGLLTVTFSARMGTLYRPQFRSEVHTGSWTDLPDIGPASLDGQLEFTDAVTGVEERYYRVLVP